MTLRLARNPGLTDARILTLALMLVFAITALPGSRAHATQTASPVVGAMNDQRTFLWQSTGGSDTLVQPYGSGLIWPATSGSRTTRTASRSSPRTGPIGRPGARPVMGTASSTFFNSIAAYARAYGDVAFDAEGNLYVADTGNFRVQKFAPDRTLLLVLGQEGRG